MRHLLLATALLGSGLAFAGTASAVRRCEPLEIECHKTCTLPQIDKEQGVYWVQC